MCHRHFDDRIHMHVHDNPMDTQHHSALTHEVSLGSATPLRIRPTYLSPQVMSPTCTTRTTPLRTSTCPSPATRCKVLPILAVNKLPLHYAASIWFNQVQKMHQGNQVLILNCLSKMLRHSHTIVPMTWLKPRASVMRPAAFQN